MQSKVLFLFQYFFERLSFTKHTRLLVQVNFFLNVVENFALIGLSFISSRERFEVHKFCFGAFVFCSSIFMCLTYYLITRCGFMPQNRQVKIFYWKNEFCDSYFSVLNLQVRDSVLTLQEINFENLLFLHTLTGVLLLPPQWVLWALRLQCFLPPRICHRIIQYVLPYDGLSWPCRGYGGITEAWTPTRFIQGYHANYLKNLSYVGNVHIECWSKTRSILLESFFVFILYQSSIFILSWSAFG